ncbi:ectoine/hydroxyectoine ABC transporter permease subunit EhuC [Mesorhizobium carmichaelinearum]|uniref:ectoine/hydroxyectoine ABC transporter permease subunit EhuC n=1 Tax=Mesorhizobium carmichaelinearum TaxID=1208188 RepID=UPI0024533131|nr:ectoine/hydroxyectoine ABC transporter permease subunit EhuC [Mesorhizobium carmichaelinearum]
MEALYAKVEFLPLLLRGVGVTVRIATESMIVSLLLSFVVGMGRRSRFSLLRAATVVYVEFFRGTSLLIQLFVLYFILPLYGIGLSAELTAVIGLGLNLGAYGSEIVRSAIDSIGKEQVEAARSLSLSRLVTFWKIILPQAVIIMLPSFGNQAIETVKATALVSLITIPELTFYGQTLVYSTGQTYIIWTSVLLCYLAINTPLNLIVLWAERRAGRFSRG